AVSSRLNPREAERLGTALSETLPERPNPGQRVISKTPTATLSTDGACRAAAGLMLGSNQGGWRIPFAVVGRSPCRLLARFGSNADGVPNLRKFVVSRCARFTSSRGAANSGPIYFSAENIDGAVHDSSLEY